MVAECVRRSPLAGTCVGAATLEKAFTGVQQDLRNLL